MTVSIQGVDKVNVYVQGVNVKQSLNPANDTVNKGLYDATALSTVDADLATGNIKSGITIFGKVGSASVLDVSDADAAVGEVLSPKTFYSVTGPKKTGTMPTVAIVAANDDYLAGYHAGNVGGLDAIDTDLTAVNIKTGVTIFGKVGTYDTTASAPTAAQIISGKVAWANGAQITGTMATVALDPALNAYPAGYHAGAASLTAVDADLATTNIKSGKTIFGVAGAATVQDISAANATVAQVLAANTFFSVTGGIKTGTMATVAIVAANDNYPAGYHAGDAGGLDAIDLDLASANIKSGATIFGKAGAVTVQDIADANLTVAEAPTGKKFYAVTGGVKTGTGTKTLSPASEAVAAGYYAATTLSTVDADLAVANIKSGVTIFGKLGTYAPLTLAKDVTDYGLPTLGVGATAAYYRKQWAIAANGDLDATTLTQTYTSGSLAAGFALTRTKSDTADALKTRLIMAGVQVAETIYLGNTRATLRCAHGTRALSGSVACICRIHNYGAATVNIENFDVDSSPERGADIVVGSIKQV